MSLWTNRRALYWLGAMLVLTASRPATGAPPKKLGLALFCPDVAVTPYQLFDEVDRIAQHLSKQIGRTVEGRGYKTRRDLGADIRSAKMHFGIIGGFHLASLKQVRKLLAVGSTPGGAWTLMAPGDKSPSDLKGKTLQLPDVSPAVIGFLEHGLLDANLRPKKHFKIVKSPDLFSAIEAVRIGRAAAVLAPDNIKGLSPVLPSRLQVPPPALVLLSSRVEESTVKQIRRAVLAYRGKTRWLPGFEEGQLKRYLAFATKGSRQKLPMLVLPPEALKIDPDLLVTDYQAALEPSDLNIKENFLTP